jgi:hypothetical protein
MKNTPHAKAQRRKGRRGKQGNEESRKAGKANASALALSCFPAFLIGLSAFCLPLRLCALA